jgi:hypothetical protein
MVLLCVEAPQFSAIELVKFHIKINNYLKELKIPYKVIKNPDRYIMLSRDDSVYLEAYIIGYLQGAGLT